MAEAEPTGASGGLQALNSGSGLYKLVKLGHAEATYAPTDIEVARIEAQFTGPDLRDAEKELLQIAGSEETERKALLDRCAQYDAILDHLNAKTGDAKPAKDTSDVHTTSTHGMDFAQQTASGLDAPDSATRPPAPLIRTDIGFPHDGFDLVGEDDEEDLLCDFAPSAMQSDGGFGLVSADGRVSLPVSPSVRAAGAGGSLLASHASLSIEDSMTYRHPATGEPCLSDSWHAGDFAARSGGFADASITSLRRRYRHVFGKETSSNNRQWLLRRLAEISEYDAHLGGDECDACDDGDDSGDFRSGDGSDDAGDSSPFTDGSGSAGTHADFFGAGDSAQMAHGRRASVSKLDTAGRGAMRHAYAAGRKGKRRSSDSHSTEGDAAKTDASAAGKKRRGGHHSDSDEHHEGGESPVKSSRGAGAGRGNARGNSGKGSPRGRDGVGANGRRSKHHNPWALEEAEALVDGVARCGGGKWADIKKLGFPAIEHRTAVDLKDKWRNLLRIAMLPHQPAKSAGDKKREIPAELLARVRDLAAKQAKKAAADGRSRVGGR